MNFEGLQPWIIPYAQALIAQARTPVVITSVRRTRAQQTLLWRRYRQGRQRYPVARPGNSPHEYGLAWDMWAPPGELRRLGRLWERMGGRWGGRFRDPVHFDVLRRR